MPEERLQKLLARAGYGSRRSSEEIIEQRRVTVNGKVAELGAKADPDKDDIRVDGQRLNLPDAFEYILLNKPRDVISDEDVGGNWPAAREMIPVEGHLYPVGRLDVKSQGLMLFTNDGDLAHRLTHPSFEHEKTYEVTVVGRPDEDALQQWRRGVTVEGKRTLPAEVRIASRTRDHTVLEVVMREGRKRQIRHVAAQLGLTVTRLERTKLGPLTLTDLPEGAWRRATEEEVRALKKVRRQQKPPRGKRGGPRGGKPGSKRGGQSRSKGKGSKGNSSSKRGSRRK